MALFPRVTTWVSNQVLTAAALNGEFNNILNNAQASSWIGFSANVAQMQQQTSPGGVGTESLAGSISDELQRLRFVLAYTLGQTYWYNMTGRNLGAGNLAVQTADIAAGAVTQAKRAALGQQVSLSSGAFTTTSNTYVAVTNLSVTITTTGRPVMLMLISDGASNSALTSTSTTGAALSFFRFTRDGVNNQGGFTLQTTDTGPTAVNVDVPPACCSHIDTTAAAGVHTYALQASSFAATTTTGVQNCFLVAYEL